MNPAPLPEANVTLQAPKGMEEEVTPLKVVYADIQGRDTIISAWEFTEEERKIIAAGGRLYVAIMGTSTPPLMFKVAVDFTHAFGEIG